MYEIIINLSYLSLNDKLTYLVKKIKIDGNDDNIITDIARTNQTI